MMVSSTWHFLDRFLPREGEFTAGELERLRKLIGVSFALGIARFPWVLVPSLPISLRLLVTLTMVGIMLNPFLVRYWHVRRLPEILFTIEWVIATSCFSIWLISIQGLWALPAIGTIPFYFFCIGQMYGIWTSVITMMLMCLLYMVAPYPLDMSVRLGMLLTNVLFVVFTMIVGVWYETTSTSTMEELMKLAVPRQKSPGALPPVLNDQTRVLFLANFAYYLNTVVCLYFCFENFRQFMAIGSVFVVNMILLLLSSDYYPFVQKTYLVMLVVCMFSCGFVEGEKFHVAYNLYLKCGIVFAYLVGGRSGGLSVHVLALVSMIVYRSHWNYLGGNLTLLWAFLGVCAFAAVCDMQELSKMKSKLLFDKVIGHLGKAQTQLNQNDDVVGRLG